MSEIATQFQNEIKSELQNIRCSEEWAEIIKADWAKAEDHARNSVSYAVATGKDLIAAKEELPHGEFIKMVEMKLPFGMTKANVLMRLASIPHLANDPATVDLPSAWSTLSELGKMDKADFEKAKKRGLITPETTERSARAIAGAYDTPEGEIWGEGRKPSHLPTPKEAKGIARETKRLVAASDGNIYSGATDEEADDYERQRTETFAVIDAVRALSECPDITQLINEAKSHWLLDFKIAEIERAANNLHFLKEAMEERGGIINAQ